MIQYKHSMFHSLSSLALFLFKESLPSIVGNGFTL